MNDTEDQEVSRALRDLADRHGPAGPAPVAELLHRGRRRRGLRLAAVTGSVAAVAAVAVLGATALGGGASPTTTAAGPAGGGTASASTSASASASASSGATRTGQVTAGQLAELLKSRLPAGYHPDGDPTLIGNGGVGSSDEELQKLAEQHSRAPVAGRTVRDEIGAGYTVTNGTKTGTVQITVMSGPAPAEPLTSDLCNKRPDCSVTKQPDGSTVMLYLPKMPPDLPQVWQADLYRPDGVQVLAESGNVPLPGHGQDLYAGPPPMTGEALTALVLDPVWTQGAAGH
ncbi:hypothetical protein ACFVT9_22290 [Kitasatospora cineracea]|uniref:hypothetical protein n=1 Tax=Kitasatospora cineracea TaxID=88074 RepID=UPI0033D1E4D5